MDPNIVLSPRPKVETVVGLAVQELLRAISKRNGWDEAFAYECLETGVKYKQKDVFNMSRSFAAGLQNLGLKKLDVVFIALPNCPEFPSMLFGIWDAGGVSSPINPALTADEMKRMLEHAGAKFIVTTPELVPRFESMRENIASLKSLKIIVLGGPPIIDISSFSELIKTNTNGHQFYTGADLDTRQDVALLAYSSGTTGLPKGVMLTHSNLCTALLQHIQPGVILIDTLGQNGSKEAARQIGLLPFYHIMGMMHFCYVGMASGAHTVTLPKYSPATFINAIRVHKPTILHLVTPLIAMLANDPQVTSEEFKSMKTILCGAAPIGSVLIDRFLEKAGKPIAFQDSYGMTEMTLFGIQNPNIWKNRNGSIGPMVASTMAKVVTPDETGVTLGPNQIGELLVKGPQVMKGYLNDPEATSNVIDSDGWLHTGDLCYYDEDGCFFIVDRLKELIKVKGMQVAPAELENTLREHPLILDAAVIGIPHEEYVELPRAYIVRKSSLLTEEAVHEHMKSKLAYFKQLKGGVCFVESIPKAPSGKILRRQLRDKYKAELELELELACGRCETSGIFRVGLEGSAIV